ncbi:unnamed protein product [Phaeothamnion confervicola]
MLEITQSYGSPFVRKVRICAAIKNLDGNVRFIDPEQDKARNEALRASNPLQKIPAAMLEDGSLMFDSHVICEHIDTLSPTPRLFPAAGPERWRTLTLAALADGVMEAAVLVVYEGRFRPKEKWHQEWVDKQQAKVEGGLTYLEGHIPSWTGHPDYGHIALACALGFLDHRQGRGWRQRYPKLAVWQDHFAQTVPSFAATAPPAA